MKKDARMKLVVIIIASVVVVVGSAVMAGNDPVCVTGSPLPWLAC